MATSRKTFVYPRGQYQEIIRPSRKERLRSSSTGPAAVLASTSRPLP